MSPEDHRRRWGVEGVELGIALGGASSAVEWQRLMDWVDRAEALGLHSAWVPEMHFNRGVTASPLIALSAFAARTKRLRLATTSLLLPIHSPEILARELAGLDRRSGGRLLIGLGRGFRRALFDAFGVEAAEKRDRFDATLDRILELWGSSEPTAQDPHPPLAVAAFGPKGLAQAARRGLPYLASPVESRRAILSNHRRHREGLPPDCEPDSLVVPVMRTTFVSEDRAALDRVREALAKESSAMPARGVPKALAEAAATPIEERVVIGTPAEVGAEIAAYREEIGMDLLIARTQVSGATPEECFASLERLAEICEAAA